jgi:putative inorganic carbon (hco3(-)) transporter
VLRTHPEGPGGAVPLGSVAVATVVAGMGLGWAALTAADLLAVDLLASLSGLAALALLAALVIVILRRPQAGLLLLVAAVYLNLSEILVRFHGFPSLLQLLALPLAVAGVVSLRARGGGQPFPLLLTGLLLLFPAVLLLSSTVARHPTLADERALETLKALGIYLLVVLLATSLAMLRRAAWVMVGSGSLAAALGVYQNLTGSFAQQWGGLARIKMAHLYDDVFVPRIAGPLGDPNFFSQILLPLVPVALFLGWGAAEARGRWLGYAAAGVLTAGTVLTYSRGAAVALGCIVLLSFVSRGVTRRQLAGAALALPLLLLLVPTDFARRLTTIDQLLPWGEQEVTRPDSSFAMRKILTATAWHVFLDNPLLGVGAGNYSAHFAAYADEVGTAAQDYVAEGSPRFAHSLYLEILAETGLMGLAAFGLAMAAFAVALERARRRLQSRGDPASAGLARGLQLALLGYLLSSVLLHGHFQRYLWLLLAFAAVLVREAMGEQKGAERGRQPQEQEAAA